MSVDEIRKELFRLQDIEYRKFQSRLIPTVDPDAVIGVRTPELRQYAKRLFKRENVQEFLQALPHRYFDENQLHAFILSEIRDVDVCISAVNAFLPYVDNWATCDQLNPKAFKRHQKELSEQIKQWLASVQTYTIRFGIGMLMRHFLDADFDPVYLKMVSSVQSEEYYVKMMIAWYFATALAKQYEAALPYIEHQKLDAWTHNKTIQKATESCRIASEKKAYLNSLKIKDIPAVR